MLLTLGIDSAFSIIEAVATAAYDKFKIKRGTLTLMLCTAGFVLGLVYCFQSGLHWLDVNDRFLATYSLSLVALVQTIVIGWMIGRKKFQELQDDITWVVSIKIITPAVLLVSFVLVFADLLDEGYGTYDTSVLWGAGAIPAIAIIVLSIVLMRVKGAGDAEDDE